MTALAVGRQLRQNERLTRSGIEVLAQRTTQEPAFSSEVNLTDARGLALVGLSLSTLLAALTYLYARSRQLSRYARAEEALRAAFVEGSNDAIIGETPDGLISDWNHGAERLFGYSREFALGRTAASLLLPPERADEDARIRAAIARGEIISTFDTTRLCSDGTLLDVSVSASPALAPDGRQLGFAKTLRDTSQAKRAERQVQELNVTLERLVAERTQLLDRTRHDLSRILDALPSVVSYWDSDLRNRFANAAYRSWFDVAPDALFGVPAAEFLGDRAPVSLPRMQAALLGERQRFELSLPVPGGTEHRHAIAEYLPDVVDGTVRGFYAILYDITDQTRDKARLAAALRENEALLGTVKTHAIVSITDRAGRILEVNDEFCEISGYRRQELVGQTHQVISSGTHQGSFWSAMWTSIAEGRSWRGEICNRAKDGSLYWVDSMIAPFLDAQGQIEKYVSIRFDISAAKRAALKLRESQAFLERAGQVGGVGAWQLELATGRAVWSEQMNRLFELPLGNQPARGEALKHYPAEAQKTLSRVLQTASTTGESWDLELRMVTASGKACWVHSLGEAEIENGQIVRVVGSTHDITARKRVETELLETNARIALATDSAGIGIWEYDVAGNSLRWDAWMYRLYGTPPSDAREPYAIWAEHLHPSDRERAELELSQAIRGEREFDTEFRIVRGDGDVRHLKASARVVRDENGSALRMTGVNFDITARKRAELELVRTSSLLHSVLESASEVAVIATDPNLVIKVFNRGAENLLGFRSQELVDYATPRLIHDAEEIRARGQELSELTGDVVVNGAVFTHPAGLKQARDWTYIRKDGSRVPVNLVVTAMLGDDGSLFGYLGMAHDVTRQRLQADSLKEATLKAEQANLAKSQFLANMSHEIRTPLNAVLGISYLLGQTALDSQQGALLSKIRVAGKSLLALSNDILDLSKIEAGELAVEEVAFDLSLLLEDLASVTSLQAESKGISFCLTPHDELPRELEGDVTRLNQILMNLLSNAVKFTDRGGVELRVVRQATQNGNVRLRFEVEDTGIGLSADAQTRLFTPFAQADASTTRRFGGTGLGLSIVKRLCQLMGGEVGVSSEAGTGSTFWVMLEFRRASSLALARRHQSIPVQGARGLVGLRILVVDDSQINLEVAQRILELDGARVSVASNGQEAVARLRREPQAFDLVLMDVQMPELDGRAATRIIRNELGLSELPIVALTADARESERELSLAAGMNAFVSKPFEPRQLIRTIRQHVPLHNTEATTEQARSVLAATTEWPSIDGIDTDVARERTALDPVLFRTLLGRLLDEFADPELFGEVASLDQLRAQGGAMHKLRGGSGQLGALAIHKLAGEAEAACRDGELASYLQISEQLQLELQRLTRSAEANLPPAAPIGAEPSDSSFAVDASALASLLAQLRQNSFAALKRFESLAPGLRRSLGELRFAEMRAHLNNLEFQPVALVIEELSRAE